MENENTPSRSAVYDRLMAGYCALPADQDPEHRWAWLMAAHVAGQSDLRLHLHSHWRMLGLALSQRDAREAAGQLLRLTLVPLGHALGRLPAGNVGRATVSAFKPMRPDPAVRRLLAQAGWGPS
ncbi:MAG: DUF3703 domain-containing protein [Comamonadaceae bacterium]|nr:MAG: DUF3703 domain-containing protein [Comamonadaceae bacterium]